MINWHEYARFDGEAPYGIIGGIILLLSFFFILSWAFGVLTQKTTRLVGFNLQLRHSKKRMISFTAIIALLWMSLLLSADSIALGSVANSFLYYLLKFMPGAFFFAAFLTPFSQNR